MHKKYRISFLMITWLCASAAYAQTGSELGNVNMDQSINIVDALITAQYSVGLNPPVFNRDAADVDGNGVINIVDALIIAQYCVGLINSFPAQNPEPAMEILSSGLKRNPAPDATSGEIRTAVAGMNQFAFECYQELKSGNTNLFFSPLSLTYAFGMCYAGAGGSTEAEIASVLHINLPGERYHNALNQIERTLTTPPVNPDPYAGDELQLHLANSTWGQRDYQFRTPFLDILALHYGAGLNIVDFMTAPEDCRLLINAWVSDQTAGRINDLIPQGVITPLTRLILSNAIYFKANWVDPFNPANTVNAAFYPLDGGTLNVDLMNGTVTTSYKQVAGQYQVVRLKYQGTKSNSMFIVLPAEGQFGVVENSVSGSNWTNIISGMTTYWVTLGLPKFGIEWDASLKPALRNLGMNDAFSQGVADFSGIDGTKELYIGDVMHKSFVTVDEKGTEASAATALIITAPSIPPSAVMTINRPFFFLIRNDSTGAILFMGRVMTP